MANIARLGVVLGLQSAEFVQGIEGAKRKSKELEQAFNQLKIGAAAIGAGIAAFSAKIIGFADQIDDTAKAYELATGYVLDFSEALQLSGGSVDNAGKVLGSFYSKTQEAVTGSKSLQDAFKGIGVGLDDLKSLNNEDLLNKTIEGLSKIEDPIKRNAVAAELFGKGIKGVDLKSFFDQMQHGTGVTNQQKLAIESLAKVADELSAAYFKVKTIFSTGLAAAIDTAKINFAGFGQVVEKVANVISKAFEGAVFGIGVLVESIKWAATSVNNVLRALIPGGPSLAEMGAANNENFVKNIKALAAVGTGTPTAGPSGSANRSVTAAKDSKLDQLLKELATIQQIADSYGTSLKYQLEGINLQTSKLNMTQNEAQIAQVLFDLEKKRADQIAQLQDKIAIARQTGADQKVIDALNQQIAKVNELTDAYQNQITMATEANQILSQSFEGGLLESWKKFQFEAINTAEVVSQSVDALFSGMTNALTSFIVNGKLSFADFTKAIIADLIRIQLQSMASGIFSAILGAGLSALTNNAMGPGFVGPMPARAAGGPVDSGNSYLVGENGPEIFTPSRSGAIIPNNQFGSMGGATYVTNNYIDAIDTKSFEDRLYGSSRAVWAANQYATKNISNSRTRS